MDEAMVLWKGVGCCVVVAKCGRSVALARGGVVVVGGEREM